MKVQKLEINNFRNIENMVFEPTDGVNIICGENAQGKTNLLEAIWLFTGLRSFRGSKDKDFMRFGEDNNSLKMTYFNDIREQTAEINFSDKKEILLGGIPCDSRTKLIGEFLGIIFAPTHLELIKGGPDERRKFINSALCQLKPIYAGKYVQFNKILAQRNTLLKDISYHPELMDTMEIWNDNYASIGAYLIEERKKYLDLLLPYLNEFYEGISGGREQISLEYTGNRKFEGNTREEIKEELLEQLNAHLQDDINAGFTTVGPHRDDIIVKLNDISVKNFGSQGQQRSCALSLKMAEASVIKQITGKQPVALLDDVMSELDVNRQDYILNHIDGWQVFITCCEPSSILLSKQSENGKIFEISGGKICSST